nr:EOG090X00SQ [Macrothrix elegans]
MLHRAIQKQIFKRVPKTLSDETLVKIKEHLTEHDLWGRSGDILPDADFKLPDLKGNDIAEHFLKIAEKQCGTYRSKLLDYISNGIPELPTSWNLEPGWTRYMKCGEAVKVDFPDEDAYVFDVEVCVQEGHIPTLATAVSGTHWYSWCSEALCHQTVEKSIWKELGHNYKLSELINLETKSAHYKTNSQHQRERIVIGHNVSYDRARVKEQYFLERTKLRFLDTMAMHIAVSGVTSFQRNILLTQKSILNGGKSSTGSSLSGKRRSPAVEETIEWHNVTSLNGLNDTYKLYCGGLGPDKGKRDVFVSGTLNEIRDSFQELMTYCAKDCEATFRILTVLFPEFLTRFPHPVTFAGMLEMSTAYLPVNQNWRRYLDNSEDAYKELENELTQTLKREADITCSMSKQEAFRDDPWLWDLDWSTQFMKVKKTSKTSKSLNEGSSMEIKDDTKLASSKGYNDAEERDDAEVLIHHLENSFRHLFSTKSQLYKKSPFLPGYPNWYRSLCDRNAENALFGPADITTSSQVIPKLLKLTWDGYPLFHSKDLGWGYLVPGRPTENVQQDISNSDNPLFPLTNALELFPPGQRHRKNLSGMMAPDDAMRQLKQLGDITENPYELQLQWQMATSRENNDLTTRNGKTIRKRSGSNPMFSETPDRPTWHEGIGPYDVGVPGCWFFRLPHKSGVTCNVGNPLAKDYLSKIEDGTLQTMSSSVAENILKLNKNIIYWRNARDRVLSQMVVWFDKNQLPRSIVKAENFHFLNSYGAILPQVITSGTLTRRAVESTWMTASNAYKDRLGSELKAMIQSPPGYNFVGADVDSQELWIASLIGDSHFAGEHGCTALGWMTLQGKKSEGTDMHSRTAMTAEISRDQAKVLNYGRIYGAGERFARTLLMQFNHRLSEEEATEKAHKMYAATKGEPLLRLSAAGQQLAIALGIPPDQMVTQQQLNAMRKNGWKIGGFKQLKNSTNDALIDGRMWIGGTESHMFNKLEEIALSESPETPVLKCRITRALEPNNVGKQFMTSRVNWVVQSSAVDYLHLMLVAMRYLCDSFNIEGRFCISIHDEVRYIIKEEDKFRAALALQITNLWTRSMFAFQLGIYDLPQSVAFFSSVDIDTVLRKETNLDCQTPSNPHGLKQGYGIPFGTSYDIYQIIELTKGSLES